MDDLNRKAHGDVSIRLDHFPWRKFIITLFLFAFVVRLAIAGAYLNSYDTEWNLMWGQQLGDHFFTAFNYVTDLDYPPLYFYPLSWVGWLTRFSQVGGYPPLRMMVIKFVPCLLDSLTCVIFYRLGARRAKFLGAAAAALWAINPASMFNCAFWGQTDCVLMCMAALLFLAIEDRRVIEMGVLFAAMCATKLQGLYLAPVVGMEALTMCFGSLHYKKFHFKNIRRRQVKKFLRFAAAVMGTLVVIYLPFMIGSAVAPASDSPGFWHNFFKPLTVYGGGLGKYPYITMNADNFYMLFDLNGVNDGTKILPGLSASFVGSFFLLASVALVAAVYIFGRRRSHWLAAYLLMECIFMLTCRQHERYQILTLVMLLGAMIQTGDKKLLKIFTWQSFIIFVNQFRILSAVREKSGWWVYYQSIGSGAMNDSLQSDKARVIQEGVAWLQYNGTIGKINAFLNVCVFFVSVTLALRFYFDDKYKMPFTKRAKEFMIYHYELLTEDFGIGREK